jgi:hypothetical protein
MHRIPYISSHWPVLKQWIVLYTFCFIAIGAEIVDVLIGGVDRCRMNSFDCLSFAVIAIGGAIWISMDRRRRGLKDGWWPFFTLIFGLWVIGLYLCFEYRRRALFLIPLYLLIIVALAYTQLWASWSVVMSLRCNRSALFNLS